MLFRSVDSDEHDEEGHLTEDLLIRKQMVDKRLKKIEHIKNDVIPPDLEGPNDYKNLVIGWGSTYWTIIEALENIRKTYPDYKISFLHFKQIYPFHRSVSGYLEKADNVIIFENNAQGQMANLIKLETGCGIQEKVLKYDGMPFSVEEVEENLKTFMGIGNGDMGML